MKEENYGCEMTYFNRVCLKHDSLVVERKETGKLLYIVNQCLGCPFLNEDYSDILSYLKLSFFPLSLLGYGTKFKKNYSKFIKEKKVE